MELVGDARLVVVCVPSVFAGPLLASLLPVLHDDAIILNVAKGFAPQSDEPLPIELLKLAPGHRCVHLAGPAIANDFSRGGRTYVVSASTSPDASQLVSEWIAGPVFSVTTTTDLVGAALGGVLKNIYAILLGAVSVAIPELSANQQAAIVTASVSEMAALAIALGVTYDLSNKKLLVESRTVLDRVSTLAGLYRIDGDPRHLARAKQELLGAAAFPDWNPASFLSTAEMTNAIALGYDWLYEDLTPAERETLRTAIIEKGLKPGLKVHATRKGWTQARHNWNAVCNGGLIVGALAIADTDPAIANEVLAAAKNSLPKGMLDFAPDGGWPEGPGYWDYATTYNAYSLASLQTALGTDFGFTQSPGFAETGNFRLQFVGNSGMNFNFADAPVRPGPAPQMLWFARLFGRADYDASERQLGDRSPTIFHLIWFNPRFSNPPASALPALPRSRKFAAVQVAFLRAGSGATETFAGIKGGDNRTNHAHLDLGSFVLDQAGNRFADELGPDLYTLPGYFGANRWNYYRLRTEGQNTLTLDGGNQSPDGTAPIVSFSADASRPFAVVDLTKGYPGSKKILRGISLTPEGGVTLQDEIETAEPVEVVWNFHTESRIGLNGNKAVLARGSSKMDVRILEPSGAVFETLTLPLDPPQRPAGKMKKLIIRLPQKVSTTRIVVRFSPAGQPAADAAVVPLEKW